MSQQAVIDVARAYLGYTEDPPGSNRTIFGAEYGLDGQPWCVMATWYFFQHAGERMAFFGGGKTASCSILLRWYKEQGLTVPVEDVQVGDIVLLNFHGKSDPEHCGLVVRRTDITDLPTGLPHSIWTIEGNTSASDGSQSNGGMVCEKIRYPRNIVAVCRPQYQPEPEVVVPDYKGRWSEEYWEKGIALGIVKESKDGKYRPTDAATREEVLAMIVRAKEG